jgi:chorismate mutase
MPGRHTASVPPMDDPNTDQARSEGDSDPRIARLRQDIDAINHRLLQLIAERQDISLAIGALKAQLGMPLYSHEREAQLLARFRSDAVDFDLDPDYVEELMNVVLRHSRAAQRERVGESEPASEPSAE